MIYDMALHHFFLLINDRSWFMQIWVSSLNGDLISQPKGRKHEEQKRKGHTASFSIYLFLILFCCICWFLREFWKFDGEYFCFSNLKHQSLHVEQSMVCNTTQPLPPKKGERFVREMECKTPSILVIQCEAHGVD